MAYVNLGMLIKVEERTVHITTINREGRIYERNKYVRTGRPIFGTVEGIHEVEKETRRPMPDDDVVTLKPGEITERVIGENGEETIEIVKSAKYTALVKWAGPRYRTSVLPFEVLMPAVEVK